MGITLKSGLIFLGACILGTGAFSLFVVKNTAQPSADILLLNGFTMGTSYQVQIVQGDVSFNREVLLAEIQTRLEYLDKQIFSTYDANSELSRFNQSPINTPFVASLELLSLVTLAQKIYEHSHHTFDITISPLVNLWGFGPQGSILDDILPSDTAIDQALDKMGNDAIEVSLGNKTIIKSKAVELDLSGIAKGYAVDQVAVLLEAQGLHHYLVEIGGELKLSGNKPEHESWLVGIELPDSSPGQIQASIQSTGQTIAIAGSGDYRNFFDIDGQRYSHEISPVTGRPVSHDLLGVTVITKQAAQADAYATALMIMGPEIGFNYASSNNLAAYFIMDSETGYKRRYTNEFKVYLPVGEH